MNKKQNLRMLEVYDMIAVQDNENIEQEQHEIDQGDGFLQLPCNIRCDAEYQGGNEHLSW